MNIILGESFRVIPEFGILRLTTSGKSASRFLIQLIMIASLIYF